MSFLITGMFEILLVLLKLDCAHRKSLNKLTSCSLAQALSLITCHLSLVICHLSIVQYLHLLAYGLLVDGFEHLLHELAAHLTLLALLGALLEDFVVAVVLEYGDAVLLLELTDFAGYTHALGQLLYEAVVALVYLLTQLPQVFGAMCFGTDDEHLEDIFERVGSNLL